MQRIPKAINKKRLVRYKEGAEMYSISLELEAVIQQQESSVTQHQVLILHTAIMRDLGTISAAPTMQHFQVLHHAEPVRHQLMS